MAPTRTLEQARAEQTERVFANARLKGLATRLIHHPEARVSVVAPLATTGSFDVYAVHVVVPRDH